VAYIEVVDTSRDTLTAERANAQLAGRRLIASVQLIKALGGGWNNSGLSGVFNSVQGCQKVDLVSGIQF
jgi:outer membrane protein TolC